jgi:phosphomethylpyrimidine synthase
MIAPKDSIDPQSTDTQLPNSKRIYVRGKLHAHIRVPFREIALAPTKSMNGEIEVNEPVCVYDTSGLWGDPDFHGDVAQGLPPLRAKWTCDRGDVEEYQGRKVQPIDDGWLSESHAAHVSRKRPTPPNSDISRAGVEPPTSNGARAPSRRKPLRASTDHPVTQLWYARQGIITPEMEFIAIRENMGHETVAAVYDRRNDEDRCSQSAATKEIARNDLSHQHPRKSFGPNF